MEKAILLKTQFFSLKVRNSNNSIKKNRVKNLRKYHSQEIMFHVAPRKLFNFQPRQTMGSPLPWITTYLKGNSMSPQTPWRLLGSEKLSFIWSNMNCSSSLCIFIWSVFDIWEFESSTSTRPNSIALRQERSTTSNRAELLTISITEESCIGLHASVESQPPHKIVQPRPHASEDLLDIIYPYIV